MPGDLRILSNARKLCYARLARNEERKARGDGTLTDGGEARCARQAAGCLLSSWPVDFVLLPDPSDAWRELTSEKRRKQVKVQCRGPTGLGEQSRVCSHAANPSGGDQRRRAGARAATSDRPSQRPQPDAPL